jgi:hypothetical protein
MAGSITAANSSEKCCSSGVGGDDACTNGTSSSAMALSAVTVSVSAVIGAEQMRQPLARVAQADAEPRRRPIELAAAVGDAHVQPAVRQRGTQRDLARPARDCRANCTRSPPAAAATSGGTDAGSAASSRSRVKVSVSPWRARATPMKASTTSSSSARETAAERRPLRGGEEERAQVPEDARGLCRRFAHQLDDRVERVEEEVRLELERQQIVSHLEQPRLEREMPPTVTRHRESVRRRGAAPPRRARRR